jgi:hypothetical protein
MVTMLTSALTVGYLIMVWPYEDRSVNYIEIFNEICIYGVCTCFLFFTDVTYSQPVKTLAGWITLLIIVGNIVVNLFINYIAMF